jgi:uncharacterized membrane protein YfcA
MFDPTQSLWMPMLLFVVALLYASVGQAGASGYLAVMAMTEMSPDAMKVAALTLNLMVSAIGTFQFYRAGLLEFRTFYPFAILGIPFSLVGGSIHLSAEVFYPVIGAILVLSAAQMFRSAWKRPQTAQDENTPPFLPALLTGAGIGLVSGITGTGGGIFLAPIILTMGWVSARRTGAVTATYNLLNSAGALVGASSIWASAPATMPLWLVFVSAGGAIGAFAGVRYLPERALRATLGVILLVSGLRMLF